MGNFKKAFDITMWHEGYYSNDKVDRGGETYRGISRRYHPDWAGWKIIDDAKREQRNQFPNCLEDDEQFTDLNKDLVPAYYREMYWNRFQGDDIRQQLIAEELFDTAVNMGVNRAVGFLQRAINILTMRRGFVTKDALAEDGVFGPKTYAALNELPEEHTNTVYKLMNILQGQHYLNYIERDRHQARFLMGWLNRVEVVKNI